MAVLTNQKETVGKSIQSFLINPSHSILTSIENIDTSPIHHRKKVRGRGKIERQLE